MAKKTAKRGKGNGRARIPARGSMGPALTQGVNLTPEVHAQVKQLTDLYPDVLNTMGRAVAALARGWGLLTSEQRAEAIVGRVAPVIEAKPGDVEIVPVILSKTGPLRIEDSAPSTTPPADAGSTQASSDQSAPNNI